MSTERIQLHSGIGRQFLLAYSYTPRLSLSGCLSSAVVAIARNAFTPAHATMVAFIAPVSVFSRFLV